MSDTRATIARPAGPPGVRPPEFVGLAAVVGTLLLVGLVMTFSASFVASTAQTGDPFGIFARQLFWCAVGLPLMIGAAYLDHRVWRRLALPLLAVALAACALVLVPGLGAEVNGARRWFDLGPTTVQPSELLKLALPVWCAHVVARAWPRLRRGDLQALLLPAVPVIVASTLLVTAAPDLETAVLVAVVGGAVLFVAGLPVRLIAVGGAAIAALGVHGITSTAFRRARLAAWVDPRAYADSFGYQTTQGFIALGSGGWFGVGLGQGRGKWLYIPNAHTDFIFAIIGEELGLLGALAVLALFGALAVLGVRTARNAPDPFGRLLASAIVTWILLQATINVGSVVGLLPVTGVTLPLVSFGGSSLVTTMLALGILASIARAGRRPGAAPGGGQPREAAAEATRAVSHR